MLRRLDVPTHLPKDFLLAYINENVALEIPPRPKKRHTPYFSNILCKFFVKNSCIKGDECIFSHDLSQFCSDTEGDRTPANCIHRHDAGDTHPQGSERCRMFVSPFAFD